MNRRGKGANCGPVRCAMLNGSVIIDFRVNGAKSVPEASATMSEASTAVKCVSDGQRS